MSGIANAWTGHATQQAAIAGWQREVGDARASGTDARLRVDLYDAETRFRDDRRSFIEQHPDTVNASFWDHSPIGLGLATGAAASIPGAAIGALVARGARGGTSLASTLAFAAAGAVVSSVAVGGFVGIVMLGSPHQLRLRDDEFRRDAMYRSADDIVESIGPNHIQRLRETAAAWETLQSSATKQAVIDGTITHMRRFGSQDSDADGRISIDAFDDIDRNLGNLIREADADHDGFASAAELLPQAVSMSVLDAHSHAIDSGRNA